MSAMPVRPLGPLPFWAAIGEAMTLPFRHLRAVLHITWGWALVLALATGALYRMLDDSQLKAIQEGAGIGPWSLSLVSLLIGLVVGSSVAVSWHRLLILDEPQPSAGYLRLDNTVWHYIAVAGLMLLISMPFLISAYMIGQLAPDLTAPNPSPPEVSGGTAALFLALLVGMVVAFLLTTRLALVLPARATDNAGLTLGDSWQLTRGSFWRLFGGTLICYIPTLVLGGLLGVSATASPGAFIVSTMLSSAAGLITSVFPLGFLSLAYKHLTGTGQALVAST